MIFDFLKKQKDINKKRELIVIMINALHIPNEQKTLYLGSLEILDIEWIKKLYIDLQNFIENFELKELEQIKKENFSSVAWMRKKEAEEKKKELNSFSFLLHNL